MTFNPVGGFAAPSSIVEEGAACRKCGYNLQGLATDGRCPECGTMVGVSLHGDLLRYCDPQFVNTLSRGISLILWSVLLTIVVTVLMAMLQTVARAKMAPLQQLVGLLAYIPGVVGGWLLTSPDPSGVGEDRYGTARKIIRISLVVGAVHYVIHFGNAAAGPIAPTPRLVLQSIGFLAAAVGLVGQFAQLYYLSKLALRIPDPDLSNRARQIMWGLGVSYGILLVVGFIAAAIAIATRAAPATSALMSVGCVAAIVGVVVLVYAIMYIFMLLRFGQSFKLQAALSQEIWRQHHSSPPA